MLCVKTKVAPSPIHGLGLFANEFIPAGTVIWKFTPEFDQSFTPEQVLNFPEIVQVYLVRYGSLSKKSGRYLLCADAGNYFNHSDEPNCKSEYQDDEPEVVTRALRDIEAGEELTDDYSNFEDVGHTNVLHDIAQKYHMAHELEFAQKGAGGEIR